MTAIERRPRSNRSNRCEWRTRRARRRLRRSSSPTRTSTSSTPRSCTPRPVTDDVLDITRETFPLPDARRRSCRASSHELIDGRGFVLIRGVPVDRYGKDEMSTIYWGIGTHLGRPWPQNAKGHLLGDVTDQGRGVDDPTPAATSSAAFAFPSTPTAPTSSACSASTPGRAAARASSPTR